MIPGAHTNVHDDDPEAARTFFRDLLELDSVGAGGRWPIFAATLSEF